MKLHPFALSVVFGCWTALASLNGGTSESLDNLQRSIPRSNQILSGTCKALAKPTVVTVEGGPNVCFAQFACGRENDPFERDLVTVACKAPGKYTCPPLADCLKDQTAKAETANVKWQSHTPSNYSHTVTHLEGYPELETKQIYSNEISLYATGLNSRGRQIAKAGVQPEQREEASTASTTTTTTTAPAAPAAAPPSSAPAPAPSADTK